ncbi:SGF11 [Lepeophtheirus salmonis]|uniref:SGF11 n=1 Tax=Lepeophtheirus salmonis TaxID=72036 RepID=A0A7R8H5K2_LEPSM|nr:SGF11 [Lepeophtheirus salmonis]CAF2865203.1 SGF11 [Lepeophtheirus salmonis]
MLLEGVDLKSLTASLLRKCDVEEIAESIFLELVDEISLGIGFEVHRSVKIGLFPLLDSDNSEPCSPSEAKKMGLCTNTMDVFWLCGDNGCWSSHSEETARKCMGMGRNSSRIASRRIASSSNNSNNSSSQNNSNSNSNSKDSHNSHSEQGSGGNASSASCLDEDDAEDEDWIEPGKSFNRKKRDKNSPRRNRAPKYGNSQGRGGILEQLFDGTITPPANYDQLSKEERSHLLNNICGVTLHSKKLCTRSTRCQIHTDSQRREVRFKWLSNLGSGYDEETHVDIDSFTEGDTAALRESLSILSNASSPADSTISNSSNPGNSRDSSSSRRTTNKVGHRRGKRNNKGGSKSGSRASTPPHFD